MEVILGVVILVVVLVLQFVDLPLYRRLGIDMGRQLVGSKLMVAFLAGFMVFALFSDRVPGAGQKAAISVVSLALIGANLFLATGDELEADADDEKGGETPAV